MLCTVSKYRVNYLRKFDSMARTSIPREKRSPHMLKSIQGPVISCSYSSIYRNRTGHEHSSVVSGRLIILEIKFPPYKWYCTDKEILKSWYLEKNTTTEKNINDNEAPDSITQNRRKSFHVHTTMLRIISGNRRQGICTT